MVYVSASIRRRQIVAAARRVMERDGVADASLRSVAAEAGIPLGTMQYAYRSKRRLLQAVIDDVQEEIAQVLGTSSETTGGLEETIQRNVTMFWSNLVDGHSTLQLMQYELTSHALRTDEDEAIAVWQYQRYSAGVARWCRDAASRSGESCAVPYEQLARLIVAGLDGLILQHLCDPDVTRSAQDVQALIAMVVALAAPESNTHDMTTAPAPRPLHHPSARDTL